MKSLTIRACAKVNLYLDVINRRSDGYHNIKTIFQKIAMHDVVRIGVIEKGISLNCRCMGVPRQKANLAYKVAALMRERLGIKSGIKIELVKNIPVAAGLGGGSSDAASVMTGIKRLFGLRISVKELMGLAKEIGADVPFFVSGYNCALGTGIGEKLRRIDHNLVFYILLLVPRLKIYTKTIYSKVSFPLTKPGSDVNMLARILSGNRRDGSMGELLYNRLEDIVLPAYPVVRDAKEVLISCNPEGALLSGSGPSVFAVFKSRKEAMEARSKITRDGRWQLFATRTL